MNFYISISNEIRIHGLEEMGALTQHLSALFFFKNFFYKVMMNFLEK